LPAALHTPAEVAAWVAAIQQVSIDLPDRGAPLENEASLENEGLWPNREGSSSNAAQGHRADDRTAEIPSGERPSAERHLPDLHAPQIYAGVAKELADGIYIANAGLVILWPFLDALFTNLKLMEGRAFRNDVAQQRAVAILQCAAHEEADPAEPFLPLNKLLCGMAVNDLFLLEEPLRAEEMAVVNEFLEAVIAQAPILRTMSVNGLRGTFLLRSGVLTLRDGLWLLRVEAESYDVVLERFPWSWQWVKLPWMKTPLRVEW
jgi:hypothetical protein